MKYITTFIYSSSFLFTVLLGGWIFFNIYYVEGVFPFYPLIDTKLPPGFSQAKFENIQVGMTKTEVLKAVPPPITSPIVLKNLPPIYTPISSREYNPISREKNEINGVLMMMHGTMVKTVQHLFLEILLGLDLKYILIKKIKFLENFIT